MNRRKLKNRGTACCFRKESVFLSCAKYRKHNFVSSGYCWETVSGVFIPSYGNTENSLQRHFSSTRTGRCVRSRQLSSKHKKFRREQRNASAYRYIVNFHLYRICIGATRIKNEFRARDSRAFYSPENRTYNFPVFRTFHVFTRPLRVFLPYG